MKNITIRDIANQAGVSVATVSRVINNHSNVSPKAEERVRNAIQAFNYYPNRAARELKCQTSKTIAFLIADSTNEYYSQIAQAIIQIIKEFGYTLFICNCFNDSEIEKNYLTMLYERNVDGIILNSCGSNDDFIVELSQKIPIVLVHRRISDPSFQGDFVDADFGNSTYEMTMQLIRNNHRKIGIISGPLSISSAYERFRNFKRAMKEIGMEIDSTYPYMAEGPHDSQFGYHAASILLSLPEPPTAIISGHNETCIGLLRYCQEKGVAIPDQLSVASPCNVNLVDLFYVNPSCALPDTWALGSRIGQMLLDRIRSDDPIRNREVVFMPKIIDGNAIRKLPAENE
ncbi:LacI family DNA-binding transcriptional regulator [Fusibacillus kribbianus]|uniref:LacI family DNA-binding transcriptional regulator n=1 Tax=Fusibacillus kribbianus TaxID=3044208 RepID=A0AAP4B8A5_9FIRM|nr:LacI family DNA-binding transcriptional regulator [Ruminococcus sp. YH-rum2234]MDI9241475.1 LacI family DNA-binding transcriptional regulator [Ruminococcus sp. YH-rum2234]